MSFVPSPKEYATFDWQWEMLESEEQRYEKSEQCDV